MSSGRLQVGDRGFTWPQPPRPIDFVATIILIAVSFYAMGVVCALSSLAANYPGRGWGPLTHDGLRSFYTVLANADWVVYAATVLLAITRLVREKTAFWVVPAGVVASFLCALVPYLFFTRD
ncbi:DUF6264 family protein [Rathayibacter iranicus]|uniref:Uncharacterized protein n=2 Tax=Rathayibacter iranicus TaxID=59737 RepID=A0AAD1EN61_9MICO|nr:DUF6264 family protein [Rathayibacter iranicus]AZZ56937.1 hypothetical protein C7V51_14400 [Rathayibacter iranicus]MWV29537.1 hypothetical protein [Rathayibacter iranicus NCPPB 2253 = VKM Ac-1602]PPI42296.1 hypothetical protein C5E09_13255 [Rathayibacter iranicus]PPI57601.1 hypothetical protein C5E08_14155 [Rathayibacter iranicus]PPI68716.1 hypothetical protein C5E01_13210 [Rathayibacter iranicus]